jgi:hypothetical protein
VSLRRAAFLGSAILLGVALTLASASGAQTRGRNCHEVRATALTLPGDPDVQAATLTRAGCSILIDLGIKARITAVPRHGRLSDDDGRLVYTSDQGAPDSFGLAVRAAPGGPEYPVVIVIE